MPKLYIRCDMNATIASGHVMRCLSIADAAKEKGIEACLILADENASGLVTARGYDSIILGSSWDKLESELTAMKQLVAALKVEYLLIDSYFVTEHYLAELRRLTTTIYIDDLNKLKYPVDYLIMYANYYRKFDLMTKYGDDTVLLAGCKFVPLRKEFANLPPHTMNSTIQKILILSGASDNNHIMKRMLASIAKTDRNVEVTAICGRYNPDFDELSGLYRHEKKVTILQEVPDMIHYMEQADLLISAGGTTLYEACAVGVPTICYSFADNQLDNVRQFQADGLMAYAGDARYDDIFTEAVNRVKEYDLATFRMSRSEKMQKLVDGNGAYNIIEYIFGSEKKRG